MKTIKSITYILFIIEKGRVCKTKRLHAKNLPAAILESDLYLKSKNKLLEIFEIEHEIEEIDFNVKELKNHSEDMLLWRHATRTAATRDEDGYWQLKGGEWNEIGTLLRGKQV